MNKSKVALANLEKKPKKKSRPGKTSKAKADAPHIDERLKKRIAEVKKFKRQKRRKTLIFLAVIASLIFISTFILLGPLFAIKDVKISGNTLTSTAHIYHIVKDNEAPSMFFLSDSRLANAIEAIPYIKSVTVRKDYPNTIVIQVTQRSAVYEINSNGNFYLIDVDGRILASKKKDPGLILINPPERQAFKPGSFLNQKFNWLLQILRSLPSWLKEKISSASILGGGSVNLELSSGANVEMGTSQDLTRKIYDLEAILEQVKINPGMTIDLRVASLPVTS